MLDLIYRRRKCLHDYHYYLDSMFGLVHVRTQTWSPISVHICLNGRGWATDVMFTSTAGLERLYPRLILHGMQSSGTQLQ